ncbi:uncharacterized protein LOC117182932 [Belonocnema kinseyi]|uniref:uncharacterized protein LOC117182932 n=1 Tax=Belonocnema kinseyi TaxID=2817044 RepID=UPI00143D632D|nr:uncharacterized protein LOC117182932 [Belonocnema kinseyi]
MGSSPYFAIRVNYQLVEDEKVNFPLAASVFASETYVDDLFVGGVDKVSTIALRDDLLQLASASGLRLRKWFSNSVDLLTGLDQSDHGLAIELPYDNSSGFKVLGILWSPSDDAFHFHINEVHDEISTKRSILSAVSKLYDPMGWLAPVTIVAKILLQKLWLQKLDWDHTLPSDLAQEWYDFCTKLPALSRISIPRWTFCGRDTNSIEIHGFSDASRLAYSAVVYSRIISESGEIAVKLLIAKTKVAPIKTVSIPHLELWAATLLTRLIPFVVSSL